MYKFIWNINMAYCNDCGCRMSNGICSNCQEELYIVEYQGEFIDFELSEEFKENVTEQRLFIKNKKSNV